MCLYTVSVDRYVGNFACIIYLLEVSILEEYELRFLLFFGNLQ